MGSLVICLTPYDFSGPLIDYFQRWQKLVQDPNRDKVLQVDVILMISGQNNPLVTLKLILEAHK